MMTTLPSAPPTRLTPHLPQFVLTLIDDSVDYDIQISASNSAGEGELGWCERAGRISRLQQVLSSNPGQVDN